MGAVKRTHKKARMLGQIRKLLRRLNQQLSHYGIYATILPKDYSPDSVSNP